MSDQPTSSSALLRKTDWSFVVAGFVCQLASAYYDMIRGPLIPKVAEKLHLEFTESGLFLAVGSTVATVATLSMIGALNRWSERAIVTTVSIIGLVTGLAAAAVFSLSSLLVLAAGLGITISVLGTLANVFIVEGTSPKVQARTLAGMHSMYGLGCLIASASVGWALGRGAEWSTLYSVATPIFVGLIWFALVKLKRHATTSAPRTVQTARLRWPQILVVIIFAFYAAGEVTMSVWLTTYLVSIHGMAVSDATPYLSGYFLTLTLVRVACAIWMKASWERRVLTAALTLPLIAFAIGYGAHLPLAFVAIGLYGPLFPVLLARASRTFPDKWRTMTVWIMVGLQVACGTANIVLGYAADMLGIRGAFLLPPCLLVIALVLLQIHLQTSKRATA